MSVTSQPVIIQQAEEEIHAGFFTVLKQGVKSAETFINSRCEDRGQQDHLIAAQIKTITQHFDRRDIPDFAAFRENFIIFAVQRVQ